MLKDDKFDIDKDFDERGGDERGGDERGSGFYSGKGSGGSLRDYDTVYFLKTFNKQQQKQE